MDELRAGVELSLAVFSEAAAFLKPGKRTFDDPSLGHDGEAVQLAALGDFDMGAQSVINRLSKEPSDITDVGQDALD